MKNAEIFFNQPSSFNDPFDCSTFVGSAAVSDEDLVALYKDAIQAGMEGNGDITKASEVPESFRSKANKVTNDFADKLQKRVLFENGCSCFSELNDHILMWSHYSSGHRGFCLEFDTAYDPFNGAMKVKYKESFPAFNPVGYMLSDKEDTYAAMAPLLTKYSAWSYEKEWRLFHVEANKSYGYPVEALTSVYFGAEIVPAHLEIVCLVLQGQNPNVDFYRAKKNEKKYGVDFEKFVYTPFKDKDAT